MTTSTTDVLAALTDIIETQTSLHASAVRKIVHPAAPVARATCARKGSSRACQDAHLAQTTADCAAPRAPALSASYRTSGTRAPRSATSVRMIAPSAPP